MAKKSELTVPVSADDHIAGTTKAPVTLVEYGDFECPYCGEAYGVVKELQAQLGDQLCFVFRNFPLTEVHPHALIAAQASEAAAAQDKFWQMHDYLFEHQKALDEAHLIKYADALNLDTAHFTQALNDQTYLSKVEQQEQGGEASGVEGTPTFFINGVRHEGSYDLTALLAAIHKALN